MSVKVQISQAPNTKLKFEFFLSSIYETSFTVYQNDANVYNANIDVTPHSTYDCGKNISGFPITWTIQIQWKPERSRHMGWGDCILNILPHDNQFLFEVESKIAQKGIRNGLVNVTISL